MASSSECLPRPGEHFLHTIASLWLQRLGPSELHALERSLATTKSWASACSGTDSPHWCLEAISHSVASRCGTTNQCFEQVFACDSDATVQSWLAQMACAKYLFCDICALGDDCATDLLTQQTVPIPNAELFVAGFVCRDVSTENTQRDCNTIIDGTGFSGSTFHGVLAYVQRYQPRLVVLENVQGIKSMLGYIGSVFNDMGYVMEVFELDSTLVFLPQRRVRIWFIFCRVVGVSTERIERLRMRLKYFIGVFTSDNTCLNLDDFMVPETEPRLKQEYDCILSQYHSGMFKVGDLGLETSTAGNRRTGGKRRKWLSEHLDHTADGSVSTASSMNSLHDYAELIDFFPDLLRLSDRERDILAVNNVQFPEPKPGRALKVSSSVGRVDVRTDRTGVFTTRSRYFITSRGRLLRGREMLALQGIFPPRSIVDSFEDSDMGRFAGNAFAAPVCLAVLLAAFLALAEYDSESNEQF